MLKHKGTFVSTGAASGGIPPFSPHEKLSAKNLKFCRPSYAWIRVWGRVYTDAILL
jgi:hypothetical protein